jgi:lipopolysaccharide export LptBFGC system permease protein LptF
MMLPPLLVTPKALKADLALLAVTLVPQAVPVSLPAAVAFGIAVTWPKRAVRRVLLRRALVLGLAGVVLTLATMEWLVPAGDQAFREIVFRRLTDGGIPAESIHLPRGISDRSLSELATLAVAESSAVDPALEPNQVKLALHVRLALSCATALLCMIAVAIACAVPGRTLGRFAFTGAAAFYILTFFVVPAMARIVSPAVAPWLPVVGLAAASAILLRARPPISSN